MAVKPQAWVDFFVHNVVEFGFINTVYCLWVYCLWCSEVLSMQQTVSTNMCLKCILPALFEESIEFIKSFIHPAFHAGIDHAIAICNRFKNRLDMQLRPIVGQCFKG